MASATTAVARSADALEPRPAVPPAVPTRGSDAEPVAPEAALASESDGRLEPSEPETVVTSEPPSRPYIDSETITWTPVDTGGGLVIDLPVSEEDAERVEWVASCQLQSLRDELPEVLIRHVGREDPCP